MTSKPTEQSGDSIPDLTNLTLTESSDKSGGPSSGAGGPSGNAPGDQSPPQPEYVGPSAGLYTGDELSQHVTAFVQWAAYLSHPPNAVKLYVCSPFFHVKDDKDKAELENPTAKKYDGKKVKLTIMQELMNIILAAENLTTVFYTRLEVDIRTKDDYTIKNELIDSLLPDQKVEFCKKFQNGNIKVWEAVYPQYFHCKWLAIEQGEKVDLLVTSANLTSHHLYKANDPRSHYFFGKVAESLKNRYYDASVQRNPFKQYLLFKQVDYAEYKDIKKSEFDQDFLHPMKSFFFWRSPRLCIFF